MINSKRKLYLLFIIHNDQCFCRVLHNATDRTELLSILTGGAYSNIISAIETAEMAANQSAEATVWALKVT